MFSDVQPATHKYHINSLTTMYMKKALLNHSVLRALHTEISAWRIAAAAQCRRMEMITKLSVILGATADIIQQAAHGM